MNNLKYILAMPGDSYYGIATRLDIDPHQLQIANSFLPLHPGSVVVLPDELFEKIPEPPTPEPPVAEISGLFGYYPNFHNGRTFDKVNTYTAALGRLPDMFMVSAAGSDAHAYGSAMWGQFLAADAYLPGMSGEVNVEVLVPLNPDGGGGGRATTALGRERIREALIAVANGRDDGLHRQQAERLVAAGFPAASIRIGNESDNVNYGSSATVGGNHDVYAAAFRHVADVFRSVSPDFKFSWTILSHVWAADFPENVFAAYPGNEHVDYCGMDVYYNSSTPVSPDEWLRYVRRMEEHANFALDNGKQVCYPEWASTGHDETTFFDRMIDWFSGLGDDLAYQMYFSSGGGEGGRVYDLQAYPRIWARFLEEFSV